MSSVKVSEIIKNYTEKFNRKRIYFEVNIPDKKIKEAEKKYIQLKDNETPFLFIDNRINYFSGKCGVFLTNTTFYHRWGENYSINWDDVRTVSFIEEEGMHSVLKINDDFLCFPQIDSYSMKVLTRLIQDIIELMHPELEKVFNDIPQKDGMLEEKVRGNDDTRAIDKEKTIVEGMSNKKLNLNYENLVFGCIVFIFSIYEFSTFYITNEYLIPLQDTALLKNLFSVGILPIAALVWALNIINSGFHDSTGGSEKEESKTDDADEPKLIVVIFKILLLLFSTLLCARFSINIAEALNYPIPPSSTPRVVVIIGAAIVGFVVGIIILKLIANSRLIKWMETKW